MWFEDMDLGALERTRSFMLLVLLKGRLLPSVVALKDVYTALVNVWVKNFKHFI